MAREDSAVILIVEDDTLFQSVYRTRLEQDGYRVRVASDGEEALREIEIAPPSLVLLDLVLPRLNGYEVLGKLKADARFSHIPVIILTNKGEPADVKRGMELGASDYLIKTSAHPKEIAAKIWQAIAETKKAGSDLWVALREKEYDASKLAQIAGRPADLHCDKCHQSLLLELHPKSDQSGQFDARLICPAGEK